jgi:pyruvate dehydrogenase (quinone)
MKESTMSQTASDYLVQRLHDWGVRQVFGYPGDGINGVMSALNRATDKIKFIQVRHQENAAFMACAYAKFTNRVGVCIATSGPGAIHLLNGLYDAKMDHQPVVAIVGQQATNSMGANYQQEVDLISLYKDVAGDFVHVASNAAMVRQLIDRALRIATAHHTVTCVIVPNDVQEMEAKEAPPRQHGSTFTGIGYSAPNIVPKREDLQRAADVLNEGEKVAILIGAGARDAAEEVFQVADLLGAGVAKALLGKDVLPDDLPFVTGAIGLLGTKPSWDLMMDCDTLLMIGTGFPYSEFLPKEGQARGVQIDAAPRMLSLRYPMEVPLHGDSKLTLQALLPLLDRKSSRSWQRKIEKGMSDWWEVLEARAMHGADPINPQRLFWELSPRLPDNCILTCDSGSAAAWYARDIKIRAGMRASLSGNLATMCPGVPYATAAKFAHPDRDVIALVGDGSMQMLGNGALVTISKFWKEWSNPRLIVLVLKNLDLNQVTWEQRVMNGDPKFQASQDLPAMSYAEFARMLGLDGVEIDNPEQIGPAWDSAFETDRPFVLDARCDPNVPPLPPHIRLEQAKGLMFAVLGGDVDTESIVIQSTNEMMTGLPAGVRG